MRDLCVTDLKNVEFMIYLECTYYKKLLNYLEWHITVQGVNTPSNRYAPSRPTILHPLPHDPTRSPVSPVVPMGIVSAMTLSCRRPSRLALLGAHGSRSQVVAAFLWE